MNQTRDTFHTEEIQMTRDPYAPRDPFERIDRISQTVKVGEIDVDLGPVLIRDSLGTDLQEACREATGPSLGGFGQLDPAFAGVAFRAGYGDGSYPVYADLNGDDRVAAIHIYFVNDPHDEERRFLDTAEYWADEGRRGRSR